ncbi:MAG: YkgJ family cysteine cluster protein [Candidatus Methanofastidiosia archaeon]
MREKLIPFENQGFECIECGECCRERWVPLTLRDIKRLSGKRDISEFTMIFGKMLVLERRIWDNGCVFLKGNLCSVHKIKPIICRLYPIVMSKKPLLKENISYFKDEEEIFLYIDTSCEGVSRGKRLSLEKILRECQRLKDDMEKTREVLRI